MPDDLETLTAMAYGYQDRDAEMDLPALLERLSESA
jgi:hypothetical protein